MKRKFLTISAALIFLVASLVSAETSQVVIQGNGYIEVEGFKEFSNAINPATGRPTTLDELRRMAIMNAYRYLAESIGNLNIESSSQMINLSSLDDVVRTRVEKMVLGAKVISVTRDSQNNFTAKVRLNLFGGQDSVANVIVPKDVQKMPFPKPMVANIDANYTGLIVDCSGQDLSTAVLPKIISNSGEEIYAFKYLDRNMVVNRGMVNYADSANPGLQRAGNNPLTVQAVFLQGDNCDVIVSDDDAQKILAANQKSNFLSNCMVVFVK